MKTKSVDVLCPVGDCDKSGCFLGKGPKWIVQDVPRAIANHRNERNTLQLLYNELEALRQTLDRSESVNRDALTQRVEQSKAIILAILGEGK